MPKPPPLPPFFAQMRDLWIPLAEIRREAWAIGGRHRGEILAGARLEAKTPGLSFRRAILLRAVIRHEGRAARVRIRPQPQKEQP